MIGSGKIPKTDFNNDSVVFECSVATPAIFGKSHNKYIHN